MPSTLRRTNHGLTNNAILFLLSELYGNCSLNFNASRSISINRPVATEAYIVFTSLSQSSRLVLNASHNLIDQNGTYNKAPHPHNRTPFKDNPIVLLDRTADSVKTHRMTSHDTQPQQVFKSNHGLNHFFTAPFPSYTKD